MKVLLLSHRVPYPPNKGEKIRTYHQLSHLLDRGHNIEVVTPLENSDELQFAEALTAKLNVPVEHAKLTYSPLRMARGLLTNVPLSVSNFHSKKLQKRIDELLNSTDYDAVMCTSSAMAEYVLNDTTFKIIKNNGVRLIMDFMDLDSLKWKQFASLKPWPLSLIYKREEKLLTKTEQEILKSFDASLFVSAEEVELLKANPDNKNKVHVVSNGVDANAYFRSSKKQTSADKPQFLFTGVMDYFPNEQAVIWFAEDVWPLVIAKYPQAQFIIAGMLPSKKVQALAEIKGVVVTGFIEDILPYYQNADIMVAPFKVARGIQNKVLQGMASGLPVISSAAGAAGISCTDGVNILIAKTPEDYINAAVELLSNKLSYNNIQKAGRDLVVKHYSWDAKNAKLENILMGRQQSTDILQTST